MKIHTGRVDYFGAPVITNFRPRQIERASGISSRIRDIDKAMRQLRSVAYAIIKKTA